MNNFLKVDVTDSTLNITAYNEVGPEIKFNMNYTVYGYLVVKKTIESPAERASPTSSTAKPLTTIHSSGVLELFDRRSALVHLLFEKLVPLGERQIIGMKNGEGKRLNLKSIAIRGRKSSRSIPNKGSFGQQYDAKVVHVKLRKPGVNESYYGHFSKGSRLGIYAIGPHSTGGMISFSLWFKTRNENEMVLVHYGQNFGNTISYKDMFTLTLNNGTPILYSSPESALKPLNKDNLNDGQWHHLAVSMPKKSCRLSVVDMFIDGKNVKTKSPAINNHHFFVTSGSMSIGGFGYTSRVYDSTFPTVKPFIGGVDEFYLWSKPIKKKDLICR